MCPEVILAYEMNGEPLTPVHGFPLRTIVPGYIGARSVKWLDSYYRTERAITKLFSKPSLSLFAAHIGPETVEWEQGVMLGEMNVTSVICSHYENECIPAGLVTVQGYSITGGTEIARVEVSWDGGSHWVQAELFNDTSCWAWTFWKASLELTTQEDINWLCAPWILLPTHNLRIFHRCGILKGI
jgi:sulfite oxidase